jgi:capsular polysaccharide biosynthesis protein
MLDTFKVFEVAEEFIDDRPTVVNSEGFEFWDHSNILSPTAIYNIPDVTIVKDFIYDSRGNFLPQLTWLGTSYSSQQLSCLSRYTFNSKVEILNGKTLYLAATWGGHNIGHAVLDGLTRMACYDSMGISFDDYDHILVNNLNPETAKIVEMMGVPFSKLKYIESSQYKCESLTISEIPGRKRQYKTMVGEYFKKVISNSAMFDSPKRDGMVLLNRVNRKPINEDDMIKVAEAHGLNVHKSHPKERDFYDADLIISPNSSTLYKLMWCRPKTKVIELISTTHMYSYYFEWSRIFQLDYCGILCTAEYDSSKSPLERNITVDTQILKSLL